VVKPSDCWQYVSEHLLDPILVRTKFFLYEVCRPISDIGSSYGTSSLKRDFSSTLAAIFALVSVVLLATTK